MRRLLPLILLCAIATAADEKPATKPSTTQSTTKRNAAMERAIAAGNRWLASEIAAVKSNLDGAKGSLDGMQRGTIDRRMNPQQASYSIRDGKYLFPNQAAKDAAIKSQKEKIIGYEVELRSLESRRDHYVRPISKMELKAVGRIPTVKILQVLNKNEMLVTLRDLVIWIEVPTEGLADDTPFDPLGVYEAQETRQYNTALGTKTVFVLRRVDQ